MRMATGTQTRCRTRSALGTVAKRWWGRHRVAVRRDQVAVEALRVSLFTLADEPPVAPTSLLTPGSLHHRILCRVEPDAFDFLDDLAVLFRFFADLLPFGILDEGAPTGVGRFLALVSDEVVELFLRVCALRRPEADQR